MPRRLASFVLFVFLLAGARRAAAEPEKLKVLVPEKDNLQYMTFWVAKGGGFFQKRGIDLEMVVAPQPAKAETMFDGGEGDAAVLPPPMFLRMVAAKKPIVLVASLLRNDPINLVVRREVMEERKLTPEMPLAERMKGIKGMKIGIAPHPPARLRALLATQGMTVEKDIEMVVLPGREQNSAFHDKKVDALYAHTPFLEKAIVADDGVVLINQSAGEVKELSHRLIHGFVVRKAVHEGRQHIALAAVQALADAQTLVHTNKPQAVAALQKEHPGRSKKELEVIVDLYEKAIPETPDVRVEDIPPALDLFPEAVPKPDLAGIDLAPFVAKDLAVKAREGDGGRAGRMIVIVLGSLVAVASVLFMLLGRKSASKEKTEA
ncbi:MAG: ABC transporter substrate-binding protein [Deltaproteobacteria bacterium]|nr:ABC transporter substrate-binding protein [Deltaproteobacteria bacterium]